MHYFRLFKFIRFLHHALIEGHTACSESATTVNVDFCGLAVFLM